MALRFVLGKLGNYNKFLHSNGRAMTLGMRYGNKQLLGRAFPSHYSPHHSGDLENFCAALPITTRKERPDPPFAQGLNYHIELGGLRCANFALEEFNKIKKVRLQLLRVLGLWMKPQGYKYNPCHCLYVVIMDAVDPDGVAQSYQAHVQLHDLTEGMCLEAFYLCPGDETGRYRLHDSLYHYQDNFYGSMGDEVLYE